MNITVNVNVNININMNMNMKHINKPGHDLNHLMM